MADDWKQVPGWESWENQGGGVAAADLDGDGRPELIVLRVDHPAPAPNRGSYRVGRALDGAGNVNGGWGGWVEIPDWGSSQDQGAALAVGDLDGDGRPELIVFHIEHRVPGPNRGLYRVGKNLDAQGNVTGGWGSWIEVPDWTSWEDQGAGVAVGNLDGKPALVVFHVDNFHVGNSGRPNKGFYRVGRALDADGAVHGGWGDWIEVDWTSWFNQGAGLALTDLDGDGLPELVVFEVDNPPGQNVGKCRIGWKLDARGVARDGWGPWAVVPNSTAGENQGSGFALTGVAAGERPAGSVVVFRVDNPAGLNAGQFRAEPLPVDLDAAAEAGVWRRLPYLSPVLPVHAALLHTGKVLFFAGSGNNAFRFESVEFGRGDVAVATSVVWDFEQGDVFEHPQTLLRPGAGGRPIDFFCGGHCFLPDGRVLVVGGTDKYNLMVRNGGTVPSGHSFIGLKDALVFDPGSAKWAPVAAMARGRWYPTAVMLGDGSALAFSGMANGSPFTRTVEHLAGVETGAGAWTGIGDTPLPLYPHLFLLADGRIFFSGGRMDSDNDADPRLIDLKRLNAPTPVNNLREPEKRNQSASVLLPPAQDQKVLIMGGAPGDSDSEAVPHRPATNTVDVVNLKARPPSYTPTAPLRFKRIHVNAVILPDRTVFATGGAELREASEQGGVARPVEAHEQLEPEVYDPATGLWNARPLAPATVARLYHSVALLLPDGRVVAAGGNPDKGSQVPWLPPDPFEEMRLEVYSPPYLFRGPRPVIDAVPEEIHYGQAVTVRTAQADKVKWVSLIRPGLTTHSFNGEQRLVDVPFTRAANSLQAAVTDEPNLAPPGWYMLFLTDDTGVPSVASWVHLS